MADKVTRDMIADSGLHDYKIELISIDYTASRLVIMLKDLKGGDAELLELNSGDSITVEYA
ncbi:hypothetical protein [uncultured Ruminococcus sp.]|uniref:hypothetical protein n=1 Tax=uncultured Ruminococcus sp. TaxID=165186 RepID=UPI0025E91571|nr:hypothetical protein [uncultured Ruminococcus sp.]